MSSKVPQEVSPVASGRLIPLSATQMGAYRKDSDSGEEGFTIAGVLVFGSWQGILDALPNYYIDYRERLSSDPAVRWTDRVYPDGYWEPNLYQFYTRVYMKMYPALPVPFKLENGSRVDDTPVEDKQNTRKKIIQIIKSTQATK